jgi:hypothetical protein
VQRQVRGGEDELFLGGGFAWVGRLIGEGISGELTVYLHWILFSSSVEHDPPAESPEGGLWRSLEQGIRPHAYHSIRHLGLLIG